MTTTHLSVHDDIDPNHPYEEDPMRLVLRRLVVRPFPLPSSSASVSSVSHHHNINHQYHTSPVTSSSSSSFISAAASLPHRRRSTTASSPLQKSCVSVVYSISLLLLLLLVSLTIHPSSVWLCDVNAFSVAHHHNTVITTTSTQRRISPPMVFVVVVPDRPNQYSSSRYSTTIPTLFRQQLHMTSNRNHESDSSSNEELVPPSVELRIPVNENSSAASTTAMATTMGITSTAAALNPTISTSSSSSISSSTASSITSSSSSNNNPPFLVTLDDATQYSYTEAIQRTIAWVSAAIIFGTTVWITSGATTGEEFFAGYIVEQSLSVDNLFVFLLLFEYFKVPIQYQDRVLNWGIYGAIVMRSVMIGLGSVALQQFHFILLVFAAILVYSSVSFFLQPSHNDDDEKEDPGQNSIVRFSRSLFPSTDTFDEDRFFTLVDGIRTATPLFICMIAVEISDVVFAIDSIPAVFGVTENPLIVFSSNIFAIMGLRSLYTILSKAATDLKYLEPAVALVLGFIGSKMIAEYLDFIIPTNIALLVVASVLSTGIGLSIWEQQQHKEHDSNKEE